MRQTFRVTGFGVVVLSLAACVAWGQQAGGGEANGRKIFLEQCYGCHTLGAAGALEAALSWLTLTDDAGRLPPHWFDGERDAELPQVRLVRPGETGRPRAILSNSFAFGGSNAALVLVRD